MTAETAPAIAAAFPPIDFDSFHWQELPRRIAEGADDLTPGAARVAKPLGSLAFRLTEGGAFTYVPVDGLIDVRPGDEAADTVIELSHQAWEGLVYEFEAAAGLLYGGRARCVKGDGLRWVSWEPALRALYNGRPVWDGENAQLVDRRGAPLDPESAFTPESDPEDMAHFLRTAGYLFVRGVFAEPEIAGFLDEARELTGEAVKGDKLSWWGKNAGGEEVLCRVTRAGAKPRLRSIPDDPRMLRLVGLADERLVHRQKGSPLESVTVIYKNPDMTEGLSDIPWHRDCGMGGHAVQCPILIASVFLTPANPETGELAFIPGSWDKGMGPIDARHANAPEGAHFDGHPGDVMLHYGDTMHAAPPPRGVGLERYRISAVTGYTREGVRPHDGRRHYNEVLHGREDGQVEHLSKVARR